MPTVSDGIVAKQIEDVEANSHLCGWEFAKVSAYRFRITLAANDGDTYQIEVDYEGIPRTTAGVPLARQQDWCVRPARLFTDTVQLLPRFRQDMCTMEPACLR